MSKPTVLLEAKRITELVPKALFNFWEQKIYSKLFFDTEPDEPVPVDTLLGLFNERFGGYRMLAVHYFWEDLFWKRQCEKIGWLEKLIRL